MHKSNIARCSCCHSKQEHERLHRKVRHHVPVSCAWQVLARRALDSGADIVIASGGDGTVGAVAGVLINTGERAVAVYPQHVWANVLYVLAHTGPMQSANTFHHVMRHLACDNSEEFRVGEKSRGGGWGKT